MNNTKIISAEPPPYTLFLSPLDMLRNLYQLRSIIRQFTWREAMGRYKGTYLGLIWALINPLMTLVVYTLVFGAILKVGFGAGRQAVSIRTQLLLRPDRIQCFCPVCRKGPNPDPGQSQLCEKSDFPVGNSARRDFGIKPSSWPSWTCHTDSRSPHFRREHIRRPSGCSR